MSTADIVATVAPPVSHGPSQNLGFICLSPQLGGRRWRGCRCALRRGERPDSKMSCNSPKDCWCRRRGWECDRTVCQCDNDEFLSTSHCGHWADWAFVECEWDPRAQIYGTEKGHDRTQGPILLQEFGHTTRDACRAWIQIDDCVTD